MSSEEDYDRAGGMYRSKSVKSTLDFASYGSTLDARDLDIKSLSTERANNSKHFHRQKNNDFIVHSNDSNDDE